MVPAFALIIAAVILGLGVIIWIANRRRRESALETMRAKSVAASAPGAAPNAITQVRALLARGETIEAIKSYLAAS